ncbi:MAG: hypothetical protein NZ551_10110 [Microscillaceae bacterium]|nr:hypothetical protein [Microscillaceae bacterium]MDW8461550.1 hypothetical protein [Cytophagales bacterium]
MKKLFVLLCFMTSTFLAMANGNESQQTNTTQKVEVQNAEVTLNKVETNLNFAVGSCIQVVYDVDSNGNPVLVDIIYLYIESLDDAAVCRLVAIMAAASLEAHLSNNSN